LASRRGTGGLRRRSRWGGRCCCCRLPCGEDCVSFRGRVPKLCKRQLSARPGVAISYSPSIPPRRPVIKSLSREGRRTGGEPFTHSTHSSPPQGDQIPQPGGSPRWRGTFLCGAAVWRRAVRRCGEKRYCGVAETAVWRAAGVAETAARRCGGCCGVAKSGASMLRKSWGLRAAGVAKTAVRRCCEKLMRWCGKTAVLRNFGVAVVDRRAVAFWLTSVPLLERPPCRPSTAASGPAINCRQS
jgi:hypothetical protein